MILTEARNIFEAAGFAAGLEAGCRGVVRVTIGNEAVTQSVATGWLVTDDLVVVPGFTLTQVWTSDTGMVSVVPSIDGSDPIHATLEPRPHRDASSADDGADLESSLPILLRLARPLTGRSLPLAVTAPRPTEPV